MKGKLRIILLKTLQEEPEKSGAELSRIIKEKIGREPSPGSLYPLLNELTEKGVLESEKEGKKKVYKLTAKGKETVKGIESHKKEVVEKVIRGLKTYEYVFGEEEVENVIDYLKKMEESPENIPNCFHELDEISSLLLNNEGYDEEKVLEVLKESKVRISELVGEEE